MRCDNDWNDATTTIKKQHDTPIAAALCDSCLKEYITMWTTTHNQQTLILERIR